MKLCAMHKALILRELRMLKALSLHLFVLSICVHTFADEQVNQTEIINEAIQPQQKKNEFAIGLGSELYNYEEFDVMKESGNMTFVSLATKIKISDTSHADGQFKYSTGGLSYDGALQSSSGKVTPYKSNDKYTIYNLDINYVYERSADDLPQMDLAIGLGRRSTVDANDSSPYDYRREIIYNYLNYSLAHAFYINEAINLDVAIGGSFLISGTVNSDLSNVSASYPDIETKYNFGAASAIQIKTNLIYRLDQYKLFAALEFQKWDAENSSVKYGMVEPKNKTEIVSLSTGLIF
jgi:outer membrane receptor protein involved in Fe transport